MVKLAAARQAVEHATRAMQRKLHEVDSELAALRGSQPAGSLPAQFAPSPPNTMNLGGVGSSTDMPPLMTSGSVLMSTAPLPSPSRVNVPMTPLGPGSAPSTPLMPNSSASPMRE